MRSRTLSAVPTGTVDLSTTMRYSVMCRPIVSATASTCDRSAEPSSSGGVPTAMNWNRPWRDALCGVGRELQPALVEVALDHHVEARLVDRDLALLQARDLAGVDVDADDVIAGLGKAGARDQADVARTENCNFHA